VATSFLTGQRLTADLLNTNVIAFMPITYTKAVSTSRNTTTTLADDPELAGIPLSVGTWEVELMLHYTVASTTPKLKTRWAFTGTWNTGGAIRNVLGPSTINVAAPSQVTEMNSQGFTTDTQDAVYDSSTSSAYSAARELSRDVVVTVAGNLSLQWAQSVSNASNVTVQATSCFTIRKIS
jgi:hypothetical protein